MTREALHELIDRISEEEIVPAQRFPEYLARSAAYRATLSAPPDDEPVTRGDAEAIARARGEVQAGRVVTHEEILREFVQMDPEEITILRVRNRSDVYR